MARYKVVKVPSGINIGHGDSSREALAQIQAVIESGASGGWELVCTHTVTVTEDPEPIGCFGGLFVLLGWKQRPIATVYYVDMLIFVKKENAGEVDSFFEKNADAGGGSAGPYPTTDKYGRIDCRTWWDSDGGKHESWVDAEGNKHET